MGSAPVQVLSPALPGLQAPTRCHLAMWAQGPPTGTSSPLTGWAGGQHPELHAATPFLRLLLWAAPGPRRVTGEEVPLSAAGCTPSPGVLACTGVHHSRGGGGRRLPTGGHRAPVPPPQFCLPGCWTCAPPQPPCLFCSLPAFQFLFFSPLVHIPASHFHFLGPRPVFSAESGVVPLPGVMLFRRALLSLVSGASAVVQALC